jgi:glyoxylase-like metal-dependent hydrolase (beta-lactamase superfamily II)
MPQMGGGAHRAFGAKVRRAACWLAVGLLWPQLPGHAPDNIVVWFPDQRILFGGCLIKSASADGLGFTGDADLATWPEAVRRVAARYHPTLVVPGHGPLALGDAPLRHTLDLLTTKTVK